LDEYDSLRESLNLHQGIPYTPDWSAGADFIQLIVDHCLATRPNLVLECSSGLTSLMLARCCEMNGRGRVISLENGEEYAANTRSYIERYGLGSYADIVHAPLQRVQVDGRSFDWYALEAIPDAGIEMLVIDGPSGFIQKHSRYPALPLLYDLLADGCQIFLDDAARPDEREILAMWLRRFPSLSHRYLDTQRGCSVLTVNK
jgi:predicted O-methyltransferase YrrM